MNGKRKIRDPEHLRPDDVRWPKKYRPPSHTMSWRVKAKMLYSIRCPACRQIFVYWPFFWLNIAALVALAAAVLIPCR